MAAQQSALAAKLKLTEERYRNLHKRNKMNEEALLSLENDMRTQLRVLTRQMVELRRHLTEMNSKIDGMSGELTSVVRKHELAVLERYIDLWEPTRFVTREEAKRLIEEARDE